MAATDLPDLQDALVRRFRVREQLPALDLIPAVLPVVQVDPISVQIAGSGESPPYRRGEHAASFVFGIQAINFTLVTSGPQQAGIYDAFAHFSASFTPATSSAQNFFLMRRLAAVDITMYTWFAGLFTGNYIGEPLSFAVELQQDEELRIAVGVVATTANFRSQTEIWLHRRS